MKSDLTLKALIVGLILSVVMVAANTYLGLKVAMTISANIPCSVIAVIIFSLIFRSKSVPEVNISQATGSVGEGLAAGVIFVFPALVLSGVFPSFQEWEAKEYIVVTLAVLSGGILGVVLTGFLRRPMVAESKELRYPEGVATAEILKTGMAALAEGKTEGIWGVLIAFVGGTCVKLCSAGVAIFQESVSGAFRLGNSIFKIGADVSAALVGVGFIIEFNGALLVALGGAIAWLVFIPIFTFLHPAAGDAGEIAEIIWRDQVRFIGVGAMIVGGVFSIFQIRKQLVAGIKGVLSGISESSKTQKEVADVIDLDLSQKTIWSLIVLGIALATGVYFFSVSVVSASIATLYTLLAVFFFVAISVYIVGLIGSTNQPVSGITICTFLLAALFLFVGQVGGDDAVKTVLLIAGVVCLAACLSGTASQNFKTAMIVGGSAKAIQTGLICSVFLTSLLAAPLMVFLDKAFKIGSEKLRAPQADMFATMAKGLFSEGTSLPWNMVGVGIGLGIVLIVCGAILKKLGSSFSLSPMAVAVGIYLPFSTTLPILLGGIIHLIVTKQNKQESQLNSAIQKGTVLCAGLVAGEAITAIFIAVLIALNQSLPMPLIGSDFVRDILSVVVLLALPILIYVGIGKQKATN